MSFMMNVLIGCLIFVAAFLLMRHATGLMIVWGVFGLVSRSQWRKHA